MGERKVMGKTEEKVARTLYMGMPVHIEKKQKEELVEGL